MDPLMSRALQEMNEKRYCRKHIDPKIRAWFDGDKDIQGAIEKGVELLETYRSTTYSYDSKNARVASLASIDLAKLVSAVFVGIAYLTRPELMTSVVSQLAGRLNWDDKPAAITTMAEILAVLTDTDAFDITKPSKYDSLYIESLFVVPEDIAEFITRTEYLPPMIHEPEELVHNMSNGHLTFNDSLILGKGNHHDGDICLDVLNLVNKTKFSLNLEFLCKVEEDTSEVTVESLMDKALRAGKPINKTDAAARLVQYQENWEHFKEQSYEFYHLMESQGNVFYLTNKPDKRGRLYSQGYHISPQGTSFKKASLDLANKELIEVPDDFLD